MKSDSIDIVDFACSYVPVEIIHAAGFVPRRLLPAAPKETGLLPANLCSYARACAIPDGGEDGTVPAVFTTCCDGLRRCYDVRRARGDQVFILDLPRQANESAFWLYRQELIKMAGWLQEISGRRIFTEVLEDSYRAYRKVRLQLQNFERFVGINGNYWELLSAALTRPPQGTLELFGKFLAGFAPVKPCPEPKKRRVLLAGTILPDPKIFDLVQESNAAVVFADFCAAGRFYLDFDHFSAGGRRLDWILRGDPWLILAKVYLGKLPCPRMAGKSGRAPYIESILDDVRPAGVILTGLKFCDQGLYEVPLWRSICSRREIPFLHLEGEYQSGVLAQVKTRLEAFLETI